MPARWPRTILPSPLSFGPIATRYRRGPLRVRSSVLPVHGRPQAFGTVNTTWMRKPLPPGPRSTGVSRGPGAGAGADVRVGDGGGVWAGSVTLTVSDAARPTSPAPLVHDPSKTVPLVVWACVWSGVQLIGLLTDSLPDVRMVTGLV